jgi:hypothetical protein
MPSLDCVLNDIGYAVVLEIERCLSLSDPKKLIEACPSGNRQRDHDIAIGDERDHQRANTRGVVAANRDGVTCYYLQPGEFLGPTMNSIDKLEI